MSRFAERIIHAVTILVGGGGIVYAWMRYFAAPVDEFAIVNHPWQPFVQHLHVWTAPALVFVCGYLWHEHAWSYWRRKVRRGYRTGIALMLTCSPMIVSGYLIQTSVTPGWRQTWIVVHVASSALFLVAWIPHQWGCRHSRAARRRKFGGNAEKAETERDAGVRESTA